jgi:FtsP/CotA-like multicopper oxidase with cupredoxin domain
LRAALAGAAQLAIVLSVTGARSAEPSTRRQRYDGKPDRVLVLSDDGSAQNVVGGPFPHVLLNGESQPNPMRLRSGVTYRFRLINARTDCAATVSIFDDGQFSEWRVIAKGGADLPASQATERSATLTVAAHESYDVAFTPTTPGSLTLQFGAPKQGAIPAQATDVQVVVR